MKEKLFNLKMRYLNCLRKIIYKYEHSFLSHSISDDGYKYKNICVYCPIIAVTKVIESYFGFHKYARLNIHGINVNTQDEDCIEVTILLKYPGLLIGNGGKDITSIEEKLTSLFNKTTEIIICDYKDYFMFN